MDVLIFQIHVMCQKNIMKKYKWKGNPNVVTYYFL